MKKCLNGNIDKRSLIIEEHTALTKKDQCKLLEISRSSYYYKKADKKEFSEEEEEAMKIIDKTHLKHPSYGARKHKQNLKREGIDFTRHKVKKLMNHMHIYSIAPQPKTSTPNKKAKCAPYLLRGMYISHPNQVWSTDITYIPLGRGHVYLSAVIDWYSRYIVGWRLHETLEAHECSLCMEKSFENHGIPAITNSDQGSTYTSKEYCDLLKKYHVRQSMDGAKRWADNILIERWFRNLKYEQIYQSEYTSLKELKELIAEYIDLYNNDRIHSSLNYQTPAEWYFSGLNGIEVTADANVSTIKDKSICYYKDVA